MTRYMALRTQLQNVCAWLVHMQLQLHSHDWHWTPKNITTLKERFIIAIGIGHSTRKQLHIRLYNSYFHGKKF